MPDGGREHPHSAGVVRTRIGYFAMMAGVVLNVLVVGLLFAFDVFGTPFGVLVLSTMFFVGLVIPYVIDWIAWKLSERGRE